MARVEFGLLGPLQVTAGGRDIPVTSGRARAVLAVLALNAGRQVSSDQLVDAVWGANPPPSVRNMLHTYVWRLRTLLTGDAEQAGRIVAYPSGYSLRASPEEIDVLRFEQLVREARLPGAEREGKTAETWRAALALWRGEPLQDVVLRGSYQSERERLAEQHAVALECGIEADLALGRYESVISELHGLIGRYPLRESLVGLLMRALAHVGREPEALAAFHRLRGQLAEELGVDPAAGLCRLHESILRGQVPAAGHVQAGAAAGAVPRQLPRDLPRWVGRERELRVLTSILDDQDSGMPAAIAFIGGSAGVGKTVLAVHWAHAAAGRFPDGQLFVDLRGFDPAQPEMSAGAALGGFLQALGVPAAAMPACEDGRAALYRSVVAGKRMLVVLDNAADARQVVPLLPGGSRSVVLVTSRRNLDTLVAAHGARAVRLGELPDADAAAVLGAYAGAARLAAEPHAAGELVSSCGGLPLALAMVGALVSAHPGFALADVAARLRAESGRLDALQSADARSGVRVALSCSRRALSAEAASLFALLGLVRGPDADIAAAACLAAAPAGHAGRSLRELEGASLLLQPTPGRFRMHDLVRLYALECAGNELTARQRGAALERLSDFYLHTAKQAERMLYPQRPPVDFGEPRAGCQPGTHSGQTAALAWLDAEYRNLQALQDGAMTGGQHWLVWALAWLLTTYRVRRGLAQDHLEAWRDALAVMGHAEARLGPATATLTHRHYGGACVRVGRWAEGLEHLVTAARLAEELGDLSNTAHAHHVLALARHAAGQDDQALADSRAALEYFRDAGDPVWHVQALNLTSRGAARLGLHTEAREHGQQALTLSRRHGIPEAEADARANLGYLAHHQGWPAAAVGHYEQALTLYRHLNIGYFEASTLEHLGDAHSALNQDTQAREAWTQALHHYTIQHRQTDAARIAKHLGRAGAQQR